MQQALFVERMESVVRNFGSRVAVVDRGRPALTYDQLWRVSGQIASRLLDSGIGAESIVGLALEKSPEFIAAVLGCWRIRAAYMPLDPTLPTPRLAQMLEDADPDAILTNTDSTLDATSDAFRASDAEVIAWGDAISCDPVANPLPLGHPGDAAWVIFTSGTSDRPRGVLVQQCGYINVIDAQRKVFATEATSRVLLLYSTSFDAALSDIGTALLSGAALCLEDSRSLSQSGSILNLIRDRAITHADIPPKMLASEADNDAPVCLDTVVIGGEVCPPEVVRKWASRVRLVNVYGPTEATICTSLCECTANWSLPLLGQPVPGIEYRVVDQQDRALGPGGEGELLIAGDGVARGYMNRRDANARRFVWLDNRRFFRTGDRVRLEKGGEYTFLGRLDRQVKVRGFRIGEEEIEEALRGIAGVRRCAVVHRPLLIDSDQKHLVAFIETNEKLSAKQLRENLQMRVPSPMIPRRFECVANIPTTVSGKPDLQRLRHAKLTSPDVGLDDESGLLSIVRQILETPSLAADEDIFEAGADSYSVLAIAAAAQSEGYAVEPQELCLARTVDSLLNPSDPTPDGRSADQLREDVRSLVPPDPGALPPIAGEPEAVLLTGATGFLGSRVLAEWLDTFPGHVTCLVRASNDAEARERLGRSLDHHGIDLTAEQRSRMKIVAGDVSLRHFGCPRGRWESMAAEVDTIVHLAAAVHSYDSYETMRPTNVIGTANVVEFSCTRRHKHLHYASTLSVFVGTDRNTGIALESDSLDDTKVVYGGYAQSKWAAEVLLRSAPQSAPVDIYRFGLLTGDTKSGRFPTRDLFAMTVRGLAGMNCVPADTGQLKVDITPVDFAAKSMVTLARKQRPLCDGHESGISTWHIANPQPLAAHELFDALVEVCPTVARVPKNEFLKRVRAAEGTDEAAACLSLSRWLSEATKDRPGLLDLFQATGISFDMTRTRSELQNTGIHCPAPDQALIGRYIARILEPERQSIT